MWITNSPEIPLGCRYLGRSRVALSVLELRKAVLDECTSWRTLPLNYLVNENK